MDITDLLSWLSGGPDFSPFTGLREPVQVAFGIILAVVALMGLLFVIRGAFVWGTAGRDAQRRHQGVQDMRQGGLQILIVFALGLALAIVGGVLNSVFNAV